jgi:hypothetical protein
VSELGNAVARFIKESLKIRSLAADAGTVFPEEFTAANPTKVFRAFRALQVEKGVE